MLHATIEIERKAFGIPFTTKKKIRIPTQWSELRNRHYTALHYYFSNVNTEKEPAVSPLGLLFCHWAKLPPIYADTPQIKHNLVFMKTVAQFAKTIEHKTPLIKWWWLWKGPGKVNDNLTYEQLILAERCLSSWQGQQNDDYRDALISLTFKSPFLPWSRKWATFYQHFIKLLPAGLKIKMAYTFVGQRNQQAKLYPELYNSEKASYSLNPDQLILTQAKNDVTLYNRVAKTPCNLVLSNMHAQELAYREQKRKLEKHERKHK